MQQRLRGMRRAIAAAMAAIAATVAGAARAQTAPDAGAPDAVSLEATLPGAVSLEATPPGAAVPDAGVSPPAAASQQPVTVQVVGEKLEETLPSELGRYGTRIDTITGEQVRNAGQPDVARSLELLAPGLYVSPKNGPFDYIDVSLQGSRTEDILWLLDGVRLNNRLYGGTTPLDTFPSSIVEKLQIVEGPEALFYGTQAIAGAVNIQTRGFSSVPDGALSMGADTLGGRHLDGYYRTALGAHRFVAYASGDESDGYQAFRSQDYQPSATDRKRGYEVLTLGAKYSYDFSPDLRFTALYQHTDARLDYAKPFLVATAYNAREEEIVTGKVEYSPSRAIQLFAKGYYHLWNSGYTDFQNTLSAGGDVSGPLKVVDNGDFWGFHDVGANAIARLSAPWFDSFVGYDLQSYAGNDAVLVITRKSEVVNALFGEVRTPENLQAVRLSAGARYSVPSEGPAAAVWNVTGQANVTDFLFARGMVGTAFRLPTAEELFSNDPMDERGDANLKPEQSFNVNLSVGGNAGPLGMPGLKWETIGFLRDVTDLISASGFDSTTMQSLFENIPGTVHVLGGTVVVEGQTVPAWSGSASYTYASAEQTGDLQIDRVPRHLAKAWVDWHPADLPLGAMVVGRYAGDAYQTFGATDREKIPGHFVMDLSARVFLDGAKHHRIALSLTNVFDATYASSLGKGVTDVGGSDYTYWNLGAPRTLAARYMVRF